MKRVTTIAISGFLVHCFFAAVTGDALAAEAVSIPPSAHAKPLTHHKSKRHDKIYAYTSEGVPEYCLAAVPDSPSCVAEKKKNEPLDKQLEAELAAIPTPGSPTYAADLCKQEMPERPGCVQRIEKLEALTEQGFPLFDTDAYCRTMGDDAGGSYSIEKTCRDTEHEDEEWIKNHETSTRTMKYCARISTDAGTGSYSIMKTCIETEEEDASKL